MGVLGTLSLLVVDLVVELVVEAEGEGLAPSVLLLLEGEEVEEEEEAVYSVINWCKSLASSFFTHSKQVLLPCMSVR